MDILEKAKARRAELAGKRAILVAEVDKLDAELAELDGFFRVAARFDDSPGVSVHTVEQRRPSMLNPAKAWPFPTGNTGTNVATVPHGGKTRFIVNEVQEIIRRHGALPARKILELLDIKGVGEILIPGKDDRGRVSYLSAVLSKDATFRSDRDAGGYVLSANEQEKAPQGLDLEGLENGNDLL